MKAIALWQPWASLWLTERKIHETRHWETKHRGWIAVHAAKRFEKDFDRDEPMGLLLPKEFGADWAKTLPTGAIIGAVNLTHCLLMKNTRPASDDDYDTGNWSDVRYAWRRAEFVKLREPIPYRGLQGVFTLPDTIAQQILDPLRAA